MFSFCAFPGSSIRKPSVYMTLKKVKSYKIFEKNCRDAMI